MKCQQVMNAQCCESKLNVHQQLSVLQVEHSIHRTSYFRTQNAVDLTVNHYIYKLRQRALESLEFKVMEHRTLLTSMSINSVHPYKNWSVHQRENSVHRTQCWNPERCRSHRQPLYLQKWRRALESFESKLIEKRMLSNSKSISSQQYLQAKVDPEKYKNKRQIVIKKKTIQLSNVKHRLWQ